MRSVKVETTYITKHGLYRPMIVTLIPSVTMPGYGCAVAYGCVPRVRKNVARLRMAR